DGGSVALQQPGAAGYADGHHANCEHASRQCSQYCAHPNYLCTTAKLCAASLAGFTPYGTGQSRDIDGRVTDPDSRRHSCIFPAARNVTASDHRAVLVAGGALVACTRPGRVSSQMY